MPLGAQRGGAEILLQNWLAFDAPTSRYSLMFLEDGPLVEHARNLGYDVAVLPTTHLRSPWNFLKTVRGLRRWARQKQLLTVLSWMSKAHLYLAPATAFSGIRTVWYQHGIPSKDDRINNLISALPADAIICCSATAKASQEAISPRHTMFVCYPGVDAVGEVPSLQQAREALGLDPHALIASMVARLERWKGAHVLIAAVPKVLARYPGCRFYIAGGAHSLDPGYAVEVEQQIRSLHLEDSITLLGQRPPAEVRLLQLSSDVIVQPTSGTEPFGIAVVEGMALGKVVVASDQAGPAEVIQHDHSGILFPPSDADALAEALIDLLGDPDRRARIASAAVERSAEFSMKRFASRLDEILSQVAGAQR